MLIIKLPELYDVWDDKTERFVTYSAQTLMLQHSLISLHKWEAKWHVPFLGKDEKTEEQTLDYIKCMTVNTVDDSVYRRLNRDNIEAIRKYIYNPMTATTFRKEEPKTGGETVTAELIYYWMIAYTIPVEFEKWHLNQLLTLIRVCEIKNRPPKKMSKDEILSRNRALNEQRLKTLNTKG